MLNAGEIHRNLRAKKRELARLNGCRLLHHTFNHSGARLRPPDRHYTAIGGRHLAAVTVPATRDANEDNEDEVAANSPRL